ncbi:MAG: Eco57I restriction-modification methylase domain-containing protein [Candidatus Omnitrophota bacterium]
MSIDTNTIRLYLEAFDFKNLMIKLGWDYCDIRPLVIPVNGNDYRLEAVAEKRGLVLLICGPGPDSRIPDNSIRRKMEHQVTATYHEHMIIFVDAGKTTQVWQWVKREPHQTPVCRESRFQVGQTGEALIQKLLKIDFDLKEEPSLDIITVTNRARKAFDVESVTKRFYDRFKKEHSAFLEFIDGIDPIIHKSDREWYASLMLNRMMFIYFIQKKRFLDGDADYLKNRLRMMRERNDNGRFHEFYRLFLLRLFHEGLGQPESERKPELAELLGKVPYLNGGLFDVHSLERQYPDIKIPDEAFESVFKFFDDYTWHLDERPLRLDNEINPDVLGYIFEKYINQKEMGAYYTKEDITGYISRNTIIPYLFNAAERECKAAFEPGGPVWGLLKEDPDRYIYEAVRKGVDEELPADIARGLDDVSLRGDWNKPAAENYALPTETWREHVARRKRCLELRDRLKSGKVTNINDLITYNLDISQFAQDVIENCESPELLRAFWVAIAGRIPEKSNQEFRHGISILDPTCGSGAFLFAALNILEPLYEACLEQMRQVVFKLEPDSKKYQDFGAILAQIDGHPNERYFVLKSIIINNLYGVDIMPEAVEICKLRLFLKLVAQVDSVEHIEPLPDIDFNIRAGNTLVGFASYEETENTIKNKLKYDNAFERIEENAQMSDRAFQRFREAQTRHGMTVTGAKADLRNRLEKLHDELDLYLAGDYGVDVGKPGIFEKWRSSNRPFHWFVEFYGILKNGGFDIIIGNPPYIEFTEIKQEYQIKDFETLSCSNLYAFVIERCFKLRHVSTLIGMIVPLSTFSTDRMIPLIKSIKKNSSSLYISNFSWRPGKLFDGVNLQLSIMLSSKGSEVTHIKSSRYILWSSELRPYVFQNLEYANVTDNRNQGCIPKIGSIIANSILQKLRLKNKEIGTCFQSISSNLVFYRRGGLYWKVFVDFETKSSEEKIIKLFPEIDKYSIIAALSSNLWWWYYTITSDCRHLGNRDIRTFTFDPREMDIEKQNLLSELGKEYVLDLKCNAEKTVRIYKAKKHVECLSFSVNKSKHIIDKIDKLLSLYFGFTAEELDFIINYDIKYRMGTDSLEGAGVVDEED